MKGALTRGEEEDTLMTPRDSTVLDVWGGKTRTTTLHHTRCSSSSRGAQAPRTPSGGTLGGVGSQEQLVCDLEKAAELEL